MTVGSLKERDTAHSVEISECRVCAGSVLFDVLNLGEQHIIDFLENGQEGLTSPLRLVLCSNCHLLQLKHTVPRDLLYREYWYRSGISPTMVGALAEITESAESLIELKRSDVVVDIGANDGTLLRTYRHRDLALVGFEPAKNLLPYARDSGHIISDYFSAKTFFGHYPNEKAKVVTAIAMFYDLDEPNSFVLDIAKILDPKGIFIIQMNYLGTMIERNSLDNICHEHLEYYSLASLEFLLHRHRLEIFDVELNDVNGGSFRTYVRHVGSTVGGRASERLKRLRSREAELALDKTDTYRSFSRRLEENARKLRGFIAYEVSAGKRVYVYGASTRGNTLLQFADLDRKLIVAAADRNPAKWGRRMVGTQIPIVSKEEARRNKPDYYVILPYAFLDEIMHEEEEYLENGGKFVVPIPSPRVVTRDEEWPI